MLQNGNRNCNAHSFPAAGTKELGILYWNRVLLVGVIDALAEVSDMPSCVGNPILTGAIDGAESATMHEAKVVALARRDDVKVVAESAVVVPDFTACASALGVLVTPRIVVLLVVVIMAAGAEPD